ncbi:MAG: DUF4006 family protein [SAR324 cluster bacterium]|nr:DUF4006 family protein [SAR324 cluster bacterium]
MRSKTFRGVLVWSFLITVLVSLAIFLGTASILVQRQTHKDPYSVDDDNDEEADDIIIEPLYEPAEVN